MFGQVWSRLFCRIAAAGSKTQNSNKGSSANLQNAGRAKPLCLFWIWRLIFPRDLGFGISGRIHQKSPHALGSGRRGDLAIASSRYRPFPRPPNPRCGGIFRERVFRRDAPSTALRTGYTSTRDACATQFNPAARLRTQPEVSDLSYN
jgi:hypothetical protein